MPKLEGQADNWYAGVDIGGSKVAVSLARASEDRPQILARRSESTVREGDSLALSRQILCLLGASCADAGLPIGQLRSVGVSACGPMVMRDGMAELAAPNICGGMDGPARGLANDWVTAPLRAPLLGHFKTVRVEIDTIAALGAERRWGALQGIAHCAYVTWSTGIGMGLCVDGHVLRGKNGNAGHAGHSFVLDESEALCGCGNVGDVESLIGGNAIQRRFGIDAEQLLLDAQAGEALAQSRVDELCRVMGRTLYNLVVSLDLQLVSLGGSVFWQHREFLLPRLQRELAGKLPALTDGCSLVSAGLGSEVGDYGALSLVLEA